MDITLISTPTQIQITADLASEIWRQHFTPIIGIDQVHYMLETIQSAEAIANAIHNENYRYYLMSIDGTSFGYFAFCLKNGNVFLSKLYIRQSSRGKGYARQVLEFIEQYGHNHHAKQLWLTVNKNNSDVIDIYEKMGFEIEGPIVQDIGNGFVMDDYKMTKSINL